jgi:hypothetical protein
MFRIIGILLLLPAYIAVCIALIIWEGTGAIKDYLTKE